MNYIHYASNIVLFSITFYFFTPGILFTIPQGSSKKFVALVHALLWTAFISLILILVTRRVNGISLILLSFFGIIFYLFSPDVLFHLPPNGSKELVAGTHAFLFVVGSILYDKILHKYF
jgi:hypothetical protein